MKHWVYWVKTLDFQLRTCKSHQRRACLWVFRHCRQGLRLTVCLPRIIMFFCIIFGLCSRTVQFCFSFRKTQARLLNTSIIMDERWKDRPWSRSPKANREEIKKGSDSVRVVCVQMFAGSRRASFLQEAVNCLHLLIAQRDEVISSQFRLTCAWNRILDAPTSTFLSRQ